MENIIFETAMTRYNIVYGEYDDANYGSRMCFIAWLNNTGRGGPSLSWSKGDNLYATYVLEKTDINLADLTGILSAIKKKYPGSVGELMGFDDNFMYQGV